MDREDLTLAAVALTARIRRMAPALDGLAVGDGARLRAIAAKFREKHEGFDDARRAADELDLIALKGSGALTHPEVPQMVDFVNMLHKLVREQPMSRRDRRKSAALEERRQRRIKRSERLQAIAARNQAARQ